jgi:GTPase SAR1 family protein
MSNTSNLNVSKGTIPPLLKYKIVFLGNQAVGKSSIINRFIYDIFDGNEHVLFWLFRNPPSALISSPRTSSWRRRQSGCSSGTRPARNVFETSSPTTFATPQWP